MAAVPELEVDVQQFASSRVEERSTSPRVIVRGAGESDAGPRGEASMPSEDPSCTGCCPRVRVRHDAAARPGASSVPDMQSCREDMQSCCADWLPTDVLRLQQVALYIFIMVAQVM